MSHSLAGFVLAAGAGSRLHPLSAVRPKPLCPVGNVALVDLAIDHLARVTGAVDAERIAVNVHHHREAMEGHLGDRVHLSWEPERPRGTAGALGVARDWIAGRPVVAVNADAWHRADLRALVEGWDGERVRVMVSGGTSLEPDSRLVASLLPAEVVQRLSAEPTGLYEVCLAPARADGRLEVVCDRGPFVDCGTPADYLRANLLVSGGQPVVAPEASVEGELVRSVVWDTGTVHPGEVLVDAVRIGRRLTVLVR
jgi:N-acetyl-alpha-D-muramate 1-phosphate uridylyltransferase